MWDVDFQTAIAQAEVADKEQASAFHFLRFGIEGDDEHVVIATTRPELLAACVAVLAHPDDERYKPLFGKRAVTPLFHAPVPIMPDAQADPEKGTGIVMVCTFGDQTDVEWWQKYKLPLRQIVGRDGRLLPVTFGDAGLGQPRSRRGQRGVRPTPGHVRQEGPEDHRRDRRSRRATSSTGPSRAITHAVKFFEKGDRPLELIPTRQWYTRILDKKEALVEQGARSSGIPSTWACATSTGSKASTRTGA